MSNLYGRFERLRFASLEQLSVNGASLMLNILPAVERIGKHIANYFHSSLDILLKNSHHVGCILPRCVGIQISSHVLHLQLQIVTSSILRSLEMQMLQEVSDTASLLRFVSTSAFDEDSDAELGGGTWR